MNPPSKRKTRTWWLITICIPFAFLNGKGLCSAAQDEKSRDLRTEILSLGATPELLNPETNPTLRYPVLHLFGSVFSISHGWLEISRDAACYQVVEPPKRSDHGFETTRQDITKMKLSANILSFKAAGKGRRLFYLPPDRWKSVHTDFGMTSAAGRYAPFTYSIVQALRDFDGVVATIKPGVEPAAPPASPSKTTETTIAAPTTGSPPPPAVPTVVLVDPSISTSGQSLEVSNSTLTLRGVAMDSGGLPMVTINGSPANMKPRSTQAVEFWSDPLALKPGENWIEIIATNAAQAEAKVRFSAHYSPPPAPISLPAPPPNPKALSKTEILDLLTNYVPSARVTELVKQRGVKFSPNDDDLRQIRDAGGGDDLVEALREAATAH